MRRDRIFLYGLHMFLILSLYACQESPLQPDKEKDITPLSEQQMPPDFNFSTKNEIFIQVKAATPSKKPLKNIRFTVFDGDPENNGKKLFSGITDTQGQFERNQVIASTLKDLVITTDYIGLVDKIILPVDGTVVECDYNNLPLQPVDNTNVSRLAKTSTANDYAYLGTYNSQGKPDYLEQPGDVIDSEFLSDINASLPENRPVPDFNPQYLAAGNQINTLLSAPADVFVTFVHEGAGYRNVLGFYSYPAGSPPASVNDIDSVTIIFPNVSFSGSGGELQSGNKVNIGYFPANTEIGWVLFSNGWQGQVTSGIRQVFSEPDFNPESDPSMRQHNVLLYDAARDLTVLGFEDLNRESGSDDDFNDALFYVTSNPRTAIVNDNVTTITYTGDDSDGDGVTDPVDDYPNDPIRAYNNFYPAENSFGTLAFEDLWPDRGDYDFNDLVIDYSFKEIMNSNNEVVEIESKFILMAIGASYENGFGFELPVAPGLVQTVSGPIISGSEVTLQANGLEAGQDQAVVIAFDNVYHIMNKPHGYYINTQENAPYVNPDTVLVLVSFVSPVNPNDIGNPPYNPFIFINQNRNREVHLPGKAPTTIAMNSGLFNTGDDNSMSSGYYKTTNNLPWALDIVEPLDYPFEKITIDQAHNHFVDWAQNSGNTYSDWYKNLNGYRVPENIYNY